MCERANCFEINFDASELDLYSDEDSSDTEKKSVLKTKKSKIYQFVDPVLRKEWSFTFTLLENGRLSVTLKIDHKNKILIKLDVYDKDLEEDDGYCTSFEPKPYYRNTWTAEIDFDGDEIVMKCEMRKDVKFDDYPKPKMDRFLNAEMFSDVKLISSDNKAFFGHRCILAGASYVFNNKFIASNGESEKKEIVLDDVDSQTLDAMLKFIYTGKFGATKVDEIKPLLEVADNYGNPKLIERCVTYLDQNYSKDNVVDVLILADKFEEDNLSQNCISFIKLHSGSETVREAIRIAEIKGTILLMMMDCDNEKFPTFELKLKS